MKIYALNKNYNGISANVTFVNGVGETDRPHLIEWFRKHGYGIEEIEQKLSDTEAETDEETLEVRTEVMTEVMTDADADADADEDADEYEDEEVAINEDTEEILSLDSIDKTDVEQLKAYANQKGIDIGQSTSARGILQKITAAEKQTEDAE